MDYAKNPIHPRTIIVYQGPAIIIIMIMIIIIIIILIAIWLNQSLILPIKLNILAIISIFIKQSSKNFPALIPEAKSEL